MEMPSRSQINLSDEEDYFDYMLETDPRFDAWIARSRDQKQQGRVTLLEDIEE
jgi:hypothetical protein